MFRKVIQQSNNNRFKKHMMSIYMEKKGIYTKSMFNLKEINNKTTNKSHPNNPNPTQNNPKPENKNNKTSPKNQNIDVNDVDYSIKFWENCEEANACRDPTFQWNKNLLKHTIKKNIFTSFKK